LQYAYARIKSIFRKSETSNIEHRTSNWPRRRKLRWPSIC
jgi:arginyl-tRNA synthetase